MNRWLLLAVTLTLGCGQTFPKCKKGYIRAFCGISLYSAARVGKNDPAPTCMDRKDLTITFCQKVSRTMSTDVIDKLGTYIAQNWNENIMEFSRFGGLYATMRTGNPPQPPCDWDENPFPGTVAFDIDRGNGMPPGTTPQGLSGGSGGSPPVAVVDAAPPPDLGVCEPMAPPATCTAIDGVGGVCATCIASACCAPYTDARTDDAAEADAIRDCWIAARPSPGAVPCPDQPYPPSAAVFAACLEQSCVAACGQP